MGCPGGCVNGGGQPSYLPQSENMWTSGACGQSPIRWMPHAMRNREIASVKTLYREYLGTPGSMISHKLLHTTYTPGKFTG